MLVYFAKVLNNKHYEKKTEIVQNVNRRKEIRNIRNYDWD
jgi:hypothetical protein